MVSIAEAEAALRQAIKELRSSGTPEYFDTGPAINPGLVRDARLYPTREDALQLVPKGGVVVEIGTWRGAFARQIIERTQPSTLYIIDIDFSRFERDIVRSGACCVHLLEGRSALMADQFADNSLDFVYIDGDHSYAGCALDLERFRPKLKPGALFGVNDYTHWAIMLGMRFGVLKAVNEFVNKYRWEVAGFALERTGNHDIFIQKLL